MPILLCYATAYSLIGVLYDEKLPLAERISKTAKIKLPYPAFSESYPDVFSDVCSEIRSRLGLKVPTKAVVVSGKGSLFQQNKMEGVKVISSESALSDFDVPAIYITGEGADAGQVFKWFDFEEPSAAIENYYSNGLLYGFPSFENSWEKAFENAVIREKMHSFFAGPSNTFLERVEEVYLSGNFLYGYGDLQSLLLNFLDSVNVFGFWHLYFDADAVLGPLAGLYSKQKESVIDFLNAYKFRRVADVFVIPPVSSAGILFKDKKEQTLNLNSEGVYLIPPVEGEDIVVKVKIKKAKFEKKLFPSELGIVFDTRRRPLEFSDLRSERLSMRDNLRKQMGGWGK